MVANGRPGPRWYADAWAFRFRGALDALAGGTGGATRAIRPDRDLLAAGDRAGFWLVTDSTPNRLALRADVRAPGAVELLVTFEPLGHPDDAEPRTLLVQEIRLTPSGGLGWAYLIADLPAREAVAEISHRRLLQDLDD